tara:strand:- start:554 stop:871 length:318 start_codon:yes stop_codon:yes gene_type:complete
MKHKINVTEEDIKDGKPGQCDTCAISQALKRTFKVDEAYTEVDGGDIILTVNEKKYEVDYKNESDVLDFIFDFDQYDHLSVDEVIRVDGWSKVKPITFEIIERTE